MESNYLNLTEGQRSRKRHKGKGNFLYVRYADDFVVLCNGTKAEAQAMKEELGELLSDMGLQLSEEKTKVTHITEGFDFLGYRIIRSIGTSGKMAPKVLIPDKAIKRFQHKTRGIFAPSTTHESIRAKIQAQNWLTRGWCEYYRWTSSPSEVFSRVGHELFWDMAHWLGQKYQLTMPAVMRRFEEGNTFRINTARLVIPSEYTAKKFLAKTWRNPYTGQEKIAREVLFSYDDLWAGHENRQGQGDLREEAMLLKGTTCNMCGTALHPFEVEVDHIKPHAMFKDGEEGDRMGNLQILCTPCHRAKTKTDLKVLSRMR